MLGIRRRQLISLLGGAAAAWPFAARAQQAAMPVVGFLDPRSPEAMRDRLRGFRQGLKETGYVEEENVTIAYRWAENYVDRLPALAADLVHRKVAVIVASGGPGAAFAAKAATTTIPILFLSAEDPVRIGLVASLARPAGNLTGINFLSRELASKQLGLLRELIPKVTRLAALVDPANARITEATLRDVKQAADAIGLQIQFLNASTSQEIDAVFVAVARERPDALFVGADPFLNSRRLQLSLLAMRHAIPAIYSNREFAEVGGLLTYGSDIADAYRQVGVYAGRILKARSPQTYRSCSPPSLSWSLTTRPRGFSASRCQRHCSLLPTR
jgi:putative tryptophan/tyrosine transport system substrate-binding protein